MTEPEDAILAGLSSDVRPVVIGLGDGAGVAAFGPAADAAGSGLLLGLLAAGIVAYCNATSSAQLAALYPASGGTYVYGAGAWALSGIPRLGIRHREDRNCS